MECRSQCGACCIAPSITQAIPGMPDGKKAGEYCINLDINTLACRIWGSEEYPDLCRKFLPCELFCGTNQSQALSIIARVEIETQP
ncbi:MAG: hypothetical protein ACI93R_001081 [Flavobacteriales bacterium]|jgi:hypothetical protein